MRSKLSVTLDRGIVARLRAEAAQNNKSLSRHLEDLLVGLGYDKMDREFKPGVFTVFGR